MYQKAYSEPIKKRKDIHNGIKWKQIVSKTIEGYQKVCHAYSGRTMTDSSLGSLRQNSTSSVMSSHNDRFNFTCNGNSKPRKMTKC